MRLLFLFPLVVICLGCAEPTPDPIKAAIKTHGEPDTWPVQRSAYKSEKAYRAAVKAAEKARLAKANQSL